MRLEYTDLSELSGFLIVLERVKDVAYDGMTEVVPENGECRHSRVTLIDGDRVVLQVSKGIRGISLENISTYFADKSMDVALSKEMLGQVLDSANHLIDVLGEIHPGERRNISGPAINPVSRKYPRSCICTGIFATGGCTILVRGQKLPTFSGSGMRYNELVVQIVRQAKMPNQDEELAIVLAATGVKNDIAEFFCRSFEEVGALSQVVMLLNLASDPIIKRILTPRCALMAAELLAFEHGYHVPVVLTNMTSYREALREFSPSRGKIPFRKGFPIYPYLDLAFLYERADMIHGCISPVTQVSAFTMPNNGIIRPIPDLTGYITEGQIVLDRKLNQKGIYPPVATLPSLSRLMKDGVSKGFIREDHYDVSSQLSTSHSKVQDIHSLASVTGGDKLSELNKQYLAFSDTFEHRFVYRSPMNNRTIMEALGLGWKLLITLPRGELDWVDARITKTHYVKETRKEPFEWKQL